MAEEKWSDWDDETANVEPEDYIPGLYDSDNAIAQFKGFTKRVQLNPSSQPAYSAFQLWADSTSGCITADTGFTGVRCCIGFENYVPVYNDTGVEIPNGTPVMTTGVYFSGVPSVVEADADNPIAGIGFLGVTTQPIADGAVGVATILGAVTDVDTSLLSQAPVYIASGGGLTNTPPTYPAARVLVGGCTEVDASTGVIGVGPILLKRSTLVLPYTFTSSGVGAGTVFIAGDYDWSVTDANLTQASATITYGSANAATGAHAGIVAGGPGTVDTGQVGLRVTGTSFQDDGTRTASDSEVLTDDITSLSTDDYLETSKNWLGTITFELYVVSGTPTTYSLDFNYGFSAYVDAANTDFTLDSIRVEGIAGANDTGFTVTLRKHSDIGWTYSAAAFSPGNGTLADMATDLSPEKNLVSGKHFKYKRTGLQEFIEGSGSEGFLIEVTSTANNAVQSMSSTVIGYSEELV